MKQLSASHLALFALSALAWAAPQVNAQSQAPQSSRGTLLRFDFETATWPRVAAEAVGTIDVAGSTQPSRGLRSSAALSSGPLTIRNA